MTNPTLAGLEAVASLFRDRVIPLSDEVIAMAPFAPARTLTYTQVQVGYQQPSAYHPYLSLLSLETSFPVARLGPGGMNARLEGMHAVLAIRHEHSDPALGYAQLTDLMHDAVNKLVNTGFVDRWRFEEVTQASIDSITPTEPDGATDWGWMGQALIPFTIRRT